MSGKGKARRANAADYLRHWKTSPSDPHDSEGRQRRQENYESLTNDFYDNSTDFYLEGWGQSIHFCRYPRGREPMSQAMARDEHYLSHKLILGPGMTVLDVGCGLGGPGKEIAKFAGCKVVGVNLNPYQNEIGRELARKEGVGKDVFELVDGDFMHLPFPENSFDAVFSIDSTVCAPSLHRAYEEIFRVLKPGGRFGVYEWVIMSDKFDPSNPRHIDLRNGVEHGNGIASIRTSSEAEDAMRKAGFTLELAENLMKQDDELPWWYFCAGGTEYAVSWADWGRVVRMTGPGRVAFDWILRGLEIVGVVRKGTAVMAKTMIQGADCIAELGRDMLLTPMYFMIGQKPEAG